MKEIVSAVVLVVTLFFGTVALKNIHDSIRRAALEKAALGLPSLVELTKTIRVSPKK